MSRESSQALRMTVHSRATKAEKCSNSASRSRLSTTSDTGQRIAPRQDEIAIWKDCGSVRCPDLTRKVHAARLGGLLKCESRAAFVLGSGRTTSGFSRDAARLHPCQSQFPFIADGGSLGCSVGVMLDESLAAKNQPAKTGWASLCKTRIRVGQGGPYSNISPSASCLT